MKLALIYGYFSSFPRGPYRVSNLDSIDMTGSESFFFNMVKELALRGHQVTAFGFWDQHHTEPGIEYIPFEIDEKNDSRVVGCYPTTFDAAIAWNEPDYLLMFPPSVKRICIQQLNDFSYCRTDWKQNTDLCLFPSQVQATRFQEMYELPAEKVGVLSNCISNQDLFTPEEDHSNHKIVYCSSPDRGLHWLCEFFPEIKKKVPDAELHIYYRIDTWLNRFNSEWGGGEGPVHRTSMRARYVTEFARRWGNREDVFFHGGVPNKDIVKALQTSRVLAYPCDTVVFTEGFGVSVLDACAAGALPIISDVDAFGSIYEGSAHVIPGRPGGHRQEWLDAIVQGLTDNTFFSTTTARCKIFAWSGFTRSSRAERLLTYIKE